MDILTNAIPAIPQQAWPFLIIWTVLMKGLALWRSARLAQKHWFILMLIVNLFGVLELIYLFFFSKGFLNELMKKKPAEKVAHKISPKKKTK